MTQKETKKITTRTTLKPLFERSNYIFMSIALVLFIIGCLLMIGGRTDNPNEFNYNEIFSFRRITLAPLSIMAGFVVAIYAILKKPIKKKS